ncbi:MAG: hypothetical protein HXK93_00465 [Candidatus Nanogingivalaceae bacterium]|nr:hypothetical protein [Candidatus Nanogingivalaceae bacterium]
MRKSNKKLTAEEIQETKDILEEIQEIPNFKKIFGEGTIKALENSIRTGISLPDNIISKIHTLMIRFNIKPRRKNISPKTKRRKRRLAIKNETKNETKYIKMVNSLKETVNNRNRDIGQKNLTISELRQERNRLKEENRELSATVNRQETEIRELNHSLNYLQKIVEDPEKLLETYAKIIQENATNKASKELGASIEDLQQKNTALAERVNNLEKENEELTNIQDSTFENQKVFTNEDITEMRKLNIFVIRNNMRKGSSSLIQKKLLNDFGDKSEIFNEIDNIQQAREKIKAALSGSRFDYIVLYIDGISHSISNGFNIYKEPQIIVIKKDQENLISIKSKILERNRTLTV